MAEKVFKMFIGEPTEAWHQLSKDEQDSLMAKIEANIEKVGGKRVVLCSCRWSTEQYSFFGVDEYPSMEALQEHSRLAEEVNWYRYVNAKVTIGTEYEPPT